MLQLKNEINDLMRAARNIERGAAFRDLTKWENLQMSQYLDEVERRAARFDVMTGGGIGRSTNRSTTNNSNAGPFKSFGEQLQAVRNACLPNAQVDSRLYEVRAASGLSEGTPSDGGFLVQTDFAADIFKAAIDQSEIASRCRRIPLSSNANSIKLPAVDETSRASGSRWGGITSYWVNEADAFTASKPKFRQMTLELNKLIGLCYATDELLQDANALEVVIKQGFAEEISWVVDNCIVNGTGAGQPLGIMNSACLVTCDKESEQEADTLLFENIKNMWSRLIASSRKNAVWLINQDIEPQLFGMYISAGTGGVPVYMPANGAAGQPYGSLFGRPVIPVEQCQTLGTTGDIILADLSGYALADKGGPQFQGSMHVRFLYDEMTYRITYRCDGQPFLNSQITPANGTNTLSHFVALESRE